MLFSGYRPWLFWSLRDFLARNTERMIDLLRKWDEDHSGKIDQREFALPRKDFNSLIADKQKDINKVYLIFNMFKRQDTFKYLICVVLLDTRDQCLLLDPVLKD